MKRFLRALPVFVAALAVAASVTVASPHQAKALAACYWSDQTNVPYTDWYSTASWRLYDTYGNGAWRTIYSDVQAYRYSGSDGNCYRGYYVSVWTGDGSGCYCHAKLEVDTAPGQPAAQWDNGTVWGTRQQVTDYVGSNHLAWGRYGDLTSYVRFPSGAYGDLDFYLSAPDQPRANNIESDASSPTWGAHPYSAAGNGFYAGWS